MAKEKKIAVCRQHWTAFVVPAFIALLLFVTLVSSLGHISIDTALFLLAMIALCALDIFISYKTTYIAITETKLIGHIGFIRSKTLATPLSKVQNIGISNGLLGKIFRYHTITIDNAGTGTSEFVFKRMAKAEEFVSLVHDRT